MEWKNKDCFCFICGEAVMPNSRKLDIKSNEKLQKYYRLYFKIPYIGGLWYTPDFCCSTCTRTLYGWAAADEAKINEKKERRKKFAFKTPMIWMEPPNHDPGVCFFCNTYRKGFTSQVRSKIEYKYNEFTIPPAPRSATEEVPKFYKESAREEGHEADDSDHELDEQNDSESDDHDDNIQMEIDENINIFDELDPAGEIFILPGKMPGCSGESRRTTSSSIGSIPSVAESSVTDTYPPAKREKTRHLLSAADINDLGKNAE